MKNRDTLITAIAAHALTIIPAFLFCWEFGVGALVMWAVFDILYYLITR